MMESPEQPAVCRIVSRETEEVTLLVDAARVLWDVRIYKSTPTCCREIAHNFVWSGKADK